MELSESGFTGFGGIFRMGGRGEVVSLSRAAQRAYGKEQDRNDNRTMAI